MRKLLFPFLFVQRSVRITLLTAVFVPAFLLRRAAGSASGPRLLHRYLRACGGGFVKLGQILAMRYDLLPAAYCEELSRLLDRLPPIPFAVLAPVIEADLGRPLADCFAEIEPAPVGSASIAQVHRARLPAGELVVVKVMRPGVRELFRIDLAWCRLLVRTVGGLGPARRMGARRLVRELAQLTREELDFRREARNIHQLHERMRRDSVDHYAPRLHPELCGAAVITMELIEGLPVGDLLRAVEAGDQARLAAWAAAGLTPQRTARLLLRSVMEQTMRHRLFHADPHPANLILMPGGTLAWVDFGMVGWLDERQWLLQFKLRQAVAEERLHAAYQYLLASLAPLPPGDLGTFEPEVKEYLRDWCAAAEDPAGTLAQKSSGAFFLRLLDAVRRAGVTVPAGLLRLYRTIIISDMVMLKLDPRIDWLATLREFLAAEGQRQTAALVGEVLAPSTRDAALRALVRAPRVAADLVDWAESFLPDLSRAYREQTSRLEKLALVGLQYSRAAMLLAAGAVVVARFAAPGQLAAGPWAATVSVMDSYWGLLAAAGLLAALVCGRLIRELERTD